MDSTIQDIIKQIAYKVNEHGGKMYYVGGYVRDLYLDKEPSDIDVRVIGISKSCFNSILEQFGNTYWIKARYDIVKLMGYDIDFASPINKDGTMKTIENLTENIDFTMNSILIDIVTGEVIDPFNGIEDIKNRVIRIARINDIDDEFLAVRACRFRAKLGFAIDEKSVEKMKEFSFNEVSKQRILPELRKIMDADYRVQPAFYQVASEVGLLDKIFSPLGNLNGLLVNCNGMQLDAFEHTMRMLKYFSEFKDRISNFEEFYMICLTYHFRNLGNSGTIDECREFFENIFATNKIKNTTYYFQDHESRLFSVYNNFENMTTEELSVTYGKYRKILEDAGYFIESYNIGAIDNPTKEQLEASRKRLDAWKTRIEEVRALNVKVIKEPQINSEHKRLKKSDKKAPKEYSLEDIRDLTKDISTKQVALHLNHSAKKNRRRKHGRNR